MVLLQISEKAEDKSGADRGGSSQLCVPEDGGLMLWDIYLKLEPLIALVSSFSGCPTEEGDGGLCRCAVLLWRATYAKNCLY